MHTGPRGPLLFGWCTHYMPTTSHQPPAIFHTAPTPAHLLRARLHCHIWMCLSIHVSHCLEEFSPQTSPSGTIYPMVGVPSMCPPHPFSHFPTSGHPCGPAFFANLAPSWLAHHLTHPSVHLCTPLCTFVHPCTPSHFTFPGLVTLIQLSSDLGPPSGYHRQPSPSATRHSAHSRLLYNQVQPLQPPCCPSASPVGLHNPHSHSRIWSGQVTIHQSSTHFSLQ